MRISWQLGTAAARQGVRSHRHLQRLLKERAGLEVSLSMASALLETQPSYVELTLLAALCIALECTPDDLLEVRADPPPGGPTLLDLLTPRERRVLDLLADGLTAQAIANRLAISPRTVHRHLGHLYRKLGAYDRLSAVLRAQQLPRAAGHSRP